MTDRTAYLCLLHLHTIDEDLYRRLYEKARAERQHTADRFSRREDAVRCIAAEALLTDVLAARGMRSLPPVRRGAGGKPYLDLPDFHYNLSHGGDLVALAYGAAEIGVDVEPIQDKKSRLSIASRYFTDSERMALEHPDDVDPATLFTILWTRKESYVKYTGCGLSQGLRSFSVDTRLPWGEIHSKDGEVLPPRCYTVLTDDHHCVSLCGAFDRVQIRVMDGMGDDVHHT